MLQQEAEAGERLSRALASDLDLEAAEDREEGDSLCLHAGMLSVIREEREAMRTLSRHRDAGQPRQKVGMTEKLRVKIFNTHYDLDHSLFCLTMQLVLYLFTLSLHFILLFVNTHFFSFGFTSYNRKQHIHY